MDKKLRGIVLYKKDYKDKDVLATIFTVEEGLVNVLLRGVKKSNAKLKYAKELFTFADFGVTAKRDNGLYILTSCDVIASFPELASEPEKYFEMLSIISAVKELAKYGEQNVPLFLAFTNALKIVAYDEVQENLVFCKFLYDILDITGYMLNFFACADCATVFSGDKYLSQRIGGFVCENCKTPDCIKASESVFNNLRILNNMDYNKLKNLKLQNLDELLGFLVKIVAERPGIRVQLY